MKKKLNVGDIFAIQIENSELFFFGRILFDVKEQYDQSGQANNYLDWHKESVLIETYTFISRELKIDMFDVAINSVFIPKRDLLKRNPIQIENSEIDVTKVSFPETLKNHESQCYFTVGELALKINISTEEAYDNYKIFPTLGKMYYIELATLDIAGRRDLIVDKEDIMDNYFKFSDLRSKPLERKNIYSLLNEDENISYFELAEKQGLNLKRLF